MPREITDVGFDSDGVVLVTYLDTADVRCDSAVALRHTARIVPTKSYADAIDRLERAAHALLTEVLADWQVSPAVDLEELAEGRRQERSSGADPDVEREREEDVAAARNLEAIERSRRPIPGDKGLDRGGEGVVGGAVN